MPLFRPRLPIPPEWVNPLKGEILPLSAIPDPAYETGKMGAGFAIAPAENLIVSPVDGQIVSIFPTLHNIGIVAENGLEILLHIGLGTVHLKGKGFKQLIGEQAFVRAGTPIMEVDFPLIKYRVNCILTAVIFPELSPRVEVVWENDLPQLKYPLIY